MGPHAAKRVFYVDIFGQPAFAQALAERPDIELVGLRRDTPPSDAAAVLADAHVYQISSGVNDLPPHWLADAALLARSPRLLLVSTIGAGYDTVDVDACTRAGVLVVNQSGGGNAEAVAEHVLGMMLCLAKRVPEAERRMRRAPGVVRGDYVGRNALGKTLGVVGFGHVGRRLAELCRAALRMRVLVHDTHRDPQEIAAQGAEPAPLADLLVQSDFVAVCCALNDETRGMFGAAEFARMPPHAIFVNASRGGIHDERALAEALASKRLAGAGIDVWDVEPPPPDHPLLAFDNVIATPHIAGATVESRIEASQGAARQIIDVLDGARPPRLLNPEAWPRWCERYEQVFGRPPAAQARRQQIVIDPPPAPH